MTSAAATPAPGGAVPVVDRTGGPAGLTVDPAGGDAYTIAVRGHTLVVDQPTDAGGADAGPTPTELLVASLAGCVAFYAGRYLSRHGLSPDALRVIADYDMAADRPARVTAVRLRLTVPASLPEQRRQALLAVASHCTVHNSLTSPPHVRIELD
jgi:putative redox protein